MKSTKPSALHVGVASTLPAEEDTTKREGGSLSQSPSAEEERAKAPFADRRRGKIARLPAKVRAWMNQAMEDGVRYADLSVQLAKKGFPNISLPNLSNWYRGGYKDWRREQERLEAVRIHAEEVLKFASHFKEKHKRAFSSCNEILLLSQVNEVLKDYNPAGLKSLMEEKPEQFFTLARTVIAQACERDRRKKQKLDSKKYEDLAAEQKRKAGKAEGENQAPGLTPEILAQIEEAARLL